MPSRDPWMTSKDLGRGVVKSYSGSLLVALPTLRDPHCGVSLFGGRGSTYGALLGAVVLGSIQSGMFLLNLDSSIRLMITAAVLLAAVILDALSRRGRRSTGRE